MGIDRVHGRVTRTNYRRFDSALTCSGVETNFLQKRGELSLALLISDKSAESHKQHNTYPHVLVTTDMGLKRNGIKLGQCTKLAVA